jgi:hypothetical protein
MQSGASVQLCPSIALQKSFSPALEVVLVPVPERDVVVAVSVDPESRRTREELARVYVVAAVILILRVPLILRWVIHPSSLYRYSSTVP